MQEGDTILRELILLLAVSLPITFLFHKMRLPALVGFLITGIVLGPHGAALVTDTSVVERLAEIGVVLLLFTIGLEFSLEDIMRSSRQLFVGGGLQVSLTIAAVTGIALYFGFPPPQAVFFGFLASLEQHGHRAEDVLGPGGAGLRPMEGSPRGSFCSRTSQSCP